MEVRFWILFDLDRNMPYVVVRNKRNKNGKKKKNQHIKILNVHVIDALGNSKFLLKYFLVKIQLQSLYPEKGECHKGACIVFYGGQMLV